MTEALTIWKGYPLLPLEQRSGIYLIVNLINGKSYIGSSARAKARVVAHLNCRGNIVVARAIKKHGRESLAAFILEFVEFENLYIAEGKWIKRLSPEYNLAIVDEVGRTTMSEESRRLMSVKRKLRVTKDETRAKMREVRKNVSAETRAKMSAASTGRRHNYSAETLERIVRLGRERMLGHVHSEVTKAKMRAAAETRPPNAPVSEETRARMREAQKGKTMSLEARQKISAAFKGRKLSPEHVAKVAAAHRGMKRSAEARARMSAGHRKKNLEGDDVHC